MTTEEIEQLKNFVKRYSEINSQISLMQKSIESLAERRDNLFEELTEMKGKEKVLIDELVEKYGASEVTPNKLLKLLL